MDGGYQDYRCIPVDVLRDFALTQSQMTSIRAAAEDVGISHSAMHKFILGRTTPQPRVRRLLAMWYLVKQSEAADIDIIRPYASALSILVSGIPVPEQDAARVDAVASLHSIYSSRVSVPRWLELLLGLYNPSR